MVLSQVQLDWAKENGVDPLTAKPKKGLLFKDAGVQQEYAMLSPDFQEFINSGPGGRYTSGARSKEENDRVGGVPNSMHLSGYASDLGLDSPIKEWQDHAKKYGVKAILEPDHLHLEGKPIGLNASTSPSKPTELSEIQKQWAKDNGLLKEEVEPSPVLDKLSEVSRGIQQAPATKFVKELGEAVTYRPDKNPLVRAANSMIAGAVDPVVDLGNKVGITNDDQHQAAKAYLQSLQTQAPTPLEQQTGVDLVNDRLLPLSGENTELGINRIARSLKLPKPVTDVASGILSPVAETLGGLSTPANIGALALTPGKGLMSKVAAGSFVPGMVKGAVESGQEAEQGIREGDLKKSVKGVTQSVIDSLFATALSKGLVKKDVPAPYRQGEALNFDIPPEQSLVPIEQVPEFKITKKQLRKGVQEYTPLRKSEGYSQAKPEPFDTRSIVETKPVTQRLEVPIEPKPEIRAEKPLFPFVPERMSATREVAPITASVPERLLPREERGFTADVSTAKRSNVPYPESFSAKEQVMPESTATINTQIKALKDKRIQTVLLPEGSPTTKTPRGFKSLKTDVGDWIYNPKIIKPEAIQQQVAKGTYGNLLGHVEPKSPKATKVVTAIENGVEAKTSVVSPQNVEKQTAILKQQFPKAEIKVGGNELGEQVIGSRLEELQGTGQMKTRGLAKTLEAKSIGDRLEADLGDLPQYQAQERGVEVNKAIDVMNKDFDRAVRIAMGEEPAPKGMSPETFLVAVNERSGKLGDSDLIRKLAQHSELVKEGTTMGQRLAMLAEISPDNPMQAIKSVAREREAVASKRLGGKVREQVNRAIQQIDMASKRYAVTPESLNSFIESIKC